MDENTLIKQVNSSGFPFQIAVADLAKKTFHKHYWKVLASEQAWQNPVTGKFGYIDIVLHQRFKQIFMVMECKRMRGGSFVFLHFQRRRAISHNDPHSSWLLTNSREKGHLLWADVSIEIESYISSFCTVPGQGDKGTPMLERIATDLLDSTECFAEFIPAKVKIAISPDETLYESALFVPVIVTNAPLYICKTNPDNIDISEGMLNMDEDMFEEVPYVRFQKSFITRADTENPKFKPLLSERTIFVVNAMNLESFLTNFAEW